MFNKRSLFISVMLIASTLSSIQAAQISIGNLTNTPLVVSWIEINPRGGRMPMLQPYFPRHSESVEPGQQKVISWIEAQFFTLSGYNSAIRIADGGSYTFVSDPMAGEQTLHAFTPDGEVILTKMDQRTRPWHHIAFDSTY